MSGRRLAAAVLVAALVAGLPGDAARAAGAAALGLPPPPERPLPASRPQPAAPGLAPLLDALQTFRQTSPRGATAVAVIDASGTYLTARGPRRPLLPASTAKLFTAAAALRILGPDHRFITRVYATRPPDARGVVAGDLVVAGGGDPVLATPVFQRRVDATRPATSLRALARAVARGGVRRVRGRVLGDATILADQPLAPGWRRSYLASLDTARVSGLTVDAGLRLFRRAGQLRAAPARAPARRTAGELDRLLRASGVSIAGAAGVGRLPAGATEVARIASPPLEALLAHMLRESDNHLADGVFRMLGAVTGDPTWRGSARATRAALTDVDTAWRGVRLVDGSGLSRDHRLTADALVRLLRTMAAGPRRTQWLELLPVVGRSGTVASRLTGTQAVDRVHAKTGTLRDVRALAGTVPGRGGRDHHVAVLVNGLRSARDVAAARRLADVLTLAVVARRDGCRGPIAPPRGERPRRSPERRICGAAAAPTPASG